RKPSPPGISSNSATVSTAPASVVVHTRLPIMSVNHSLSPRHRGASGKARSPTNGDGEAHPLVSTPFSWRADAKCPKLFGNKGTLRLLAGSGHQRRRLAERQPDQDAGCHQEQPVG